MAKTNFLQLPVAIGLTGTEIVPILQPGTADGVDKRTTTGAIGRAGIASALPGALEWVIDGAGSNIASRIWGTLTVPFAATLTGNSMEADQTGSIAIDIWRCTYAQYNPPLVPTVADSITGGSPPTITAASKSQDATLAGWTTSLAEGDILAFYVPSPSTSITRVTLTLALTRVVN